MANLENLDIFNLSVNDVDLYSKEAKKESVLYSPTADKGKDGTYKSLVRFVPNPKNPNKSIVRKFIYWLEDSEGKGSYFDSPTTIGQKCPVQDLFFKLRNSESAIDKKMSEKLKRREVYYAIVQIIKDANEPELEGKYKIFKFGFKIKEKIDAELQPEFDTPTQIFDLFEGKNFELVITKFGGYNNYDNSKFQGRKTPITINGVAMENNKENKAMILSSLSEAPALEDFDFRPWTDEDMSKVDSLLSQYRSPGDKKATVMNDKPRATAQAASAPVMEEETTTDDTDDLNTFLDGLDL